MEDGGHLSSMTGFARTDGVTNGALWAWELRSVNSRGFEVRFRLPAGFDSLEPTLREAAAARIRRGSLNASLVLKAPERPARITVNEAALADALAAARRVMTAVGQQTITAECLLQIRGVLEAAEPDADDTARAALSDGLIDGFREALTALERARRREGAAIAAVLSRQVGELRAILTEVCAEAATAPAMVRDRLAAQIADLLADAALPPERLIQEAAILAVKADIREELDRLSAHLAEAALLLRERDAVGRQLDFLTQELNREANTLCAKAASMPLKRAGLALKATIDQMREQIQNIE